MLLKFSRNRQSLITQAPKVRKARSVDEGSLILQEILKIVESTPITIQGKEHFEGYGSVDIQKPNRFRGIRGNQV